jgi:NADPH:quinone reductase and related Zn-dependent oxidoreductases
MKAITLAGYGGPEVLRLRHDVPIPQPGPEDIQIKVAFAGINFMDIHTRQGKYETSQTYPVRLPCTLGMEGAGEVTAVGASVTRFKPGDRVAWCISWGCYADYAVVPQSRAARIPDGIAFDQAAASIFQGSTAHYLVHDVARLGQGSTCLVHAASGCIGQILVQLAKKAGATVFVTASTPEKRAAAITLGADYAMDYGNGAFADTVREKTKGQGVDVVFDAVGKTTLRDSFRATRKRGLVINYGSVAGSLKDLDPIELGEAGSLFLTRPRLADHLVDADMVQMRADAIFGALLDGSLSIPVTDYYTLETVQQAHDLLENRKQIGKAVLRIA